MKRAENTNKHVILGLELRGAAKDGRVEIRTVGTQRNTDARETEKNNQICSFSVGIFF